jgi:hypothetical protein
MKGSFFNAFPWNDLPKPLKDGNDPDTFVYSVKEGDTLETIAEKTMGDPAMAADLASYNGLASPRDVPPGEKIIVPYPILGVSSQILVKEKGEKEFSSPRPFDTEMRKGDQYKLRFEPNINGYCYVFREGPKATTMLFPYPPEKKRRRGRRTEKSAVRDAKVRAHEPVIIPQGKTGFKFDPKNVGERIYVFISLREIPELDDLKKRKKIQVQDIQDVMHRVKIGEIYAEEAPYKLLRISDPSEILGFSLNLKG